MNQPIRPASIEGLRLPAQAPSIRKRHDAGFASVLKQEVGRSQPVRCSAHAQQRLTERNITLTGAEHSRIASSTDAAAAKGSRATLLVMDRLALVVGVPDRTVITVMEPNAGENTVFTNIDSVVVVVRES